MGDCNRILPVEPESILQKVEVKFLRCWGIEIDIAANENSALNIAQTIIRCGPRKVEDRVQ